MSREIDNRVVQMKFDNKQFEQGVSETMKSLDGLKNSLKLDDAAKGFDVLDKIATTPTLPGDKPTSPMTIESITIETL